MKIVLVSGSIRKGSYNTILIQHIATHLSRLNNVNVTVFQEIDKLPFFSPDIDRYSLEQDSSPREVVLFRQTLRDADAIIIATQEYAFEISGVLKNALDWVVSSGEFVDKNVAILSSSTSQMGGESAYKVLLKLLKVLSANVYEKEVLNIGRINKQIDENRNLEEELEKKLNRFVEKFIENVNKNHINKKHNSDC